YDNEIPRTDDSAMHLCDSGKHVLRRTSLTGRRHSGGERTSERTQGKLKTRKVFGDDQNTVFTRIRGG
ncbi:jg671, partial [Pararge aegeria aegeria]